jgi:PAT family beta-lactamase induction signal transducer AmpG
MKLCWQKVSATQFAIYMAGANIGLSLGAGAFAALEGVLAFNQMFIALGLIFFAGVLAVRFTNFDAHNKNIAKLSDAAAVPGAG